VLERDPASSAALWRLGEIQWCCRGEYARGVTYLEQALQRDPDYEFGRRIIMRAYLDLGDAAEAQAIAASAQHPVDARLVPVLVYAREWQKAAERTYEESALGTSQGIEADLRVMAVRVHARATGQYQPALDYLAEASNVTWDDQGNPSMPDTWSAIYSVGLADLLMQKGERERAARLFDAVLKSVDDEANRRKRGDRWFLRPLAVAYAVLGREDEALSALERSLAIGQLHAFKFYLDSEPAFERLHPLPRYRALLEKARLLDRSQRQELDRMRAAGLVPHRSKK
jgi:tetratricopeptide (TPR) repeat protein